MALPQFNTNQFRQGVYPGQLDLSLNPTPNVFTCRINPGSSTAGVLAGGGLKLSDLSTADVNGVPIVDVQTADTDIILGCRVFDVKNGTVTKGNIVQVAGAGAVVWLQGKTTMNRGAGVALDTTIPGGVIALTTGKYVFGILLDKVITAGDMVRVLITANGTKYSGVST